MHLQFARTLGVNQRYLSYLFARFHRILWMKMEMKVREVKREGVEEEENKSVKVCE